MPPYQRLALASLHKELQVVSRNKPFPFQVAFDHGVYHSSGKQTRMEAAAAVEPCQDRYACVVLGRVRCVWKPGLEELVAQSSVSYSVGT